MTDWDYPRERVESQLKRLDGEMFEGKHWERLRTRAQSSKALGYRVTVEPETVLDLLHRLEKAEDILAVVAGADLPEGLRRLTAPYKRSPEVV